MLHMKQEPALDDGPNFVIVLWHIFPVRHIMTSS